MKYKFSSSVLALSVFADAMLAAPCGQNPPVAAATTVSDANPTSKMRQARASGSSGYCAVLQTAGPSRRTQGGRGAGIQGGTRAAGLRETVLRALAPKLILAARTVTPPSLFVELSRVQRHYDRLIEKREEEVREYQALAVEYREMATGVGSSQAQTRE